MNTLLVILLVLAMIATVGALVRGVVILLKTKEHELMSGTGPTHSGLQQNKAMRARIMFQALAVLIVVLLLMLRR
ncbi:twin transmembrane helix small protein [Sphingomonas quercus]|uniref:Twin transmembrane helix small protein n=1 Tax=Sphingomonas quercus TaxID=2842451 RepID=A0ABS6BIQ7_9SPHN|nr:twin transmembrane helix small protein [Sphingomonas quercus]MBU3078197.1 twin transmembrane helix small protein [Sphingomonas quercus]